MKDECPECEKLKKKLDDLAPLIKVGTNRREYNKTYARQLRVRKREARATA